MGTYRFVTLFDVTARREDVFDAMLTPERAMSHADNVRSLERLATPGPDGVGGRWQVEMEAHAPYRLDLVLETVRTDRPRRIEGRSSGDLEGIGVWEFEDRGDRTEVTYHWDVATTKPWMNVLGPLARPVFVHNHHLVMRELVDALARSLDAEILNHRAHEVRPRHSLTRDVLVPTLTDVLRSGGARTTSP